MHCTKPIKQNHSTATQTYSKTVFNPLPLNPHQEGLRLGLRPWLYARTPCSSWHPNPARRSLRLTVTVGLSFVHYMDFCIILPCHIVQCSSLDGSSSASVLGLSEEFTKTEAAQWPRTDCSQYGCNHPKWMD